MTAQSARSNLASAIETFVSTFQTAAGIFAPGHLGELTWWLPFELVDAVLAATGTVERRLRSLPSRVGVYFVLALALFPGLGSALVWAKLVAALPHANRPSAKALRDLRRRLGEAPLRELFEVVAMPLAPPHGQGSRFGRWRTVSFDGCKSIKVPDTARNLAWLGKPGCVRGVVGYPILTLMTLVETGTRALIGARFGPWTSETGQARTLTHLLKPDMLVLGDRGLDATDLMEAIDTTGAAFLIRRQSNRRPAIVARLPDGSHLARLGRLTIRIIVAAVTVTCADGTTWTETYRLATTLRDHRVYPPITLARLYHERWEHETTYLAIRHVLLHGRVLRSGDPVGLRQEMWALLTVHQLLRIAMVNSITARSGLDPDRLSFTTAVTTAQDLVIRAAHIIDDAGDPIGDIGRAVLADLIPPRRPRVSARKVKSALSRYNKADPHRPLTSKKITRIDTQGLPADDLTTRAGP